METKIMPFRPFRSKSFVSLPSSLSADWRAGGGWGFDFPGDSWRPESQSGSRWEWDSHLRYKLQLL